MTSCCWRTMSMVLIAGILCVNGIPLNKDAGIKYLKRTDGWCEGWIKTIDDCSAAAIKLGISRPGVVAVSDGFTVTGFAGSPPFCYYKGGKLLFNPGGKNTGLCGVGQACLCQKTTIPSPTIRIAGGGDSGLLEVYAYGLWGSVCTGGFDSA